MIARVSRGLALKCDATGCTSTYQPRRPVYDLTTAPEQVFELEAGFRLRASRQGWSSVRIADRPWRDCCPEHSYQRGQR